MSRRVALPVDGMLPDIGRALQDGPAVVVVAAPGAGKTTRVPPALLDHVAEGQQVLVLEPRRLAARLAASQVARETGTAGGDLVGWQVRFESRVGPGTRLVYMTEGILQRRLVDDPHLHGVGAVVLDEFHERHLQTDLALACAWRLVRATRPDLRVVVMSATLDAGTVSRFLGDCPVVESAGRLHAVEVAFMPPEGERPLHAQVAAALRRLLDDGLAGDVLVFLPGASEIRRAGEAIAPLAARHDLLVAPLHGDLPLEAQERAVRPGERRKVILSTNVAESSITVEGVVAVIDSGLARVAHHAPWTGLPRLQVERVSQASAAQRAGRAGRLRPGRCLRLYSRADHDARPQHDTAEIHRADLAEVLLHLRGSGLDLEGPDWFEPPPPSAVESARALLERLGAWTAAGIPTETGRRMLTLPVHPRLARVVVEAVDRGVGEMGCLAAALLSEREVLADERVALGGGGGRGPRMHGDCDVTLRVAMLQEARRARLEAGALRRLGLDEGASRAVDRAARQLERAARPAGQGRRGHDKDDAELRQALLAGFPDRVARCRPRGRQVDLVLCGGGSARLADASVVREAEWLVALSVESSAASPHRGGPLVRLASRIEPEWLLDLGTDSVREEEELSWNPDAERVEAVRRLLYGTLVLDESRDARVDPAQARPLLAAAVRRLGAEGLGVRAGAERYLARVAFVARTCPGAGLDREEAGDLEAGLESLCLDRTSLREVREAVERGGVVEALASRLTPEQRALVARMAPETTSLPRRKQVRVHYALAQDPWIESRLQDFLGMRQGPRVADGRVPLVLHLLAPSMRPVQVTTDLEGFWKRTYPQVRRELCRRYPRHSWPEDPLASP